MGGDKRIVFKQRASWLYLASAMVLLCLVIPSVLTDGASGKDVFLLTFAVLLAWSGLEGRVWFTTDTINGGWLPCNRYSLPLSSLQWVQLSDFNKLQLVFEGEMPKDFLGPPWRVGLVHHVHDVARCHAPQVGYRYAFRDALGNDEPCGCLSCGARFASSDIRSWARVTWKSDLFGKTVGSLRIRREAELGVCPNCSAVHVVRSTDDAAFPLTQRGLQIMGDIFDTEIDFTADLVLLRLTERPDSVP